MKFNIFEKVKTLVKKNDVEAGVVGLIIDVLNDPREGYIVEFCNDEDYSPWATETYYPNELDKI